MLDSRSRILLKALVEHYIEEGIPVGSHALSKTSGLDLSPATIRHIMSDLENSGYITSPHTSAGRIPTPKGYRIFVDTLLIVQPLEKKTVTQLQGTLTPNDPQRLVNAASKLLSKLTNFAGIVQVPRRVNVRVRHIEFVLLSEYRILLILVSEDGDVQNHILITERAYTQIELADAASCINQSFAGCDIETMRQRILKELHTLRADISALMRLAIETDSMSANTSLNDTYILSGERHLLDIEDLSSNMTKVKGLFALFEQKTSLMTLMNTCSQAPGVKLFIGKESGLMPLNECSLVTAPYETNGRVVGTLGIIGPTRMAYERMIPIVDITAKLLSSALSHTSGESPIQKTT